METNKTLQSFEVIFQFLNSTPSVIRENTSVLPYFTQTTRTSKCLLGNECIFPWTSEATFSTSLLVWKTVIIVLISTFIGIIFIIGIISAIKYSRPFLKPMQPVEGSSSIQETIEYQNLVNEVEGQSEDLSSKALTQEFHDDENINVLNDTPSKHNDNQANDTPNQGESTV